MKSLKATTKIIPLSLKEIKNAPRGIVELYKHARILKNTREVHREARGAAQCFSHFSSVLQNFQMRNITGKVLYFFYKMLKKLRALKLVT